MVHGEQSADGRRDERGVECADQRQVPTGGVSEARDGSRRVLNRLLALSEDRAGGADGDRDFSRPQSGPKGPGHVVAGTGRYGRADRQAESGGGLRGKGTGLIPWAENRRHGASPIYVAVDEFE